MSSSPELQPDLAFSAQQAQPLLEAWFGGPVRCTGIERLRGGMVNTVLRLDFDRPPNRAVVKLHTGAGSSFQAEARGLRYLRAETACPVPQVYLVDTESRLIPYAFLLMEHLPGQVLDGVDLEPAAQADLEIQLADLLGGLHEHTGRRWGRIDDANGAASWADLFLARLGSARAHPLVDERLEPAALAALDVAIAAAPALLADAGTPTLVHGDVWAGNLLVEREGERWRISGLLDPDVQFADVEYELAYLEVFDASRATFFEAYLRHHRLRPGYQQRRQVYWLYTALVHVALFGDEFFCEFTTRTAASIAQLVRAGRV
mgnify:CR=1 FL=1